MREITLMRTDNNRMKIKMNNIQQQLDSEVNKTNVQEKMINKLVARLQQLNKNDTEDLVTQSKETVTEIHASHDTPHVVGLELQ